MKQIMTGKTVMPAELENKISAILKSIAQALQVISTLWLFYQENVLP